MLKKILITGGAGFIGGHLSEYLINKGYQVTSLDDLSTGNLSNLKNIKGNNKFEFIEDSIFNEKLIAKLISTNDYIIHLAASVGVKNIIDNPLKSILNNTKGKENIFKHASNYNKKVIYASTSEIYGKQTKVPLYETDGSFIGSSMKSRWSYATAKLLEEFLGLAYKTEKKLNIIILRFFNTVGPRQSGQYGMVVPSFINNAKKNEDLIVHGDGNQKRNFTCVFEVLTCLEKLLISENAYGQIFNIGSPHEISINNLAKKIITKLNSSSKLVHIPYNKIYNDNFEDMERRFPNCDKLFNFIKTKPIKNIDLILDDMI